MKKIINSVVMCGLLMIGFTYLPTQAARAPLTSAQQICIMKKISNQTVESMLNVNFNLNEAAKACGVHECWIPPCSD